MKNTTLVLTTVNAPYREQLDAQTLGTIFYDTDETQPGGSGVFFRTMPAANLRR